MTDPPPFLVQLDLSAPVTLLVAVEGPTRLTATDFASLRDSVVAVHPEAEFEVVDDREGGTLGARLWLGPPGGPTDALDLAATTAFLEAAAVLTAGAADELVVEMRGEPIGWIHSGQVDRSLREGLLDPWREGLSGV